MMWQNAIESFLKNKKIIIGLLAVGILAAAPLGVWASGEGVFEIVDEDQVVHNEVMVDPITGDIIPEDDGIGSNTNRLSDDVYYDRESLKFVYNLGSDSGSIVTSSVVDGMMTNDMVSISVGSSVTAKLYKYGKEQTDADLSAISDAGLYVLLLSCNGQLNDTVLRFQIVDKYTNVLGYAVPEGFTIGSAFFNGEPTEASDSYVSFENEGEYVVSYICDSTNVAYTISCSVDHTAPTLALEAVGEDGYARSAVDISDLEAGASIFVEYNGDKINAGNKLTSAGRYMITVVDEAGNANIYSFIIRVYYTISLIVCVILLLLVIGGLIAYVVISEKKMKVR